MTETASPSGSAKHPTWAVIIGWIGLLGHIAVGFLYLAAGLAAPAYGIVILWILWAALLALAIMLLRSRPAWTIIVPLVALGVLYGGLALGAALWGWSA